MKVEEFGVDRSKKSSNTEVEVDKPPVFPIHLKYAFAVDSVSSHGGNGSQQELLVELELSQGGGSNRQTVVVQKKKGNWPYFENLLDATGETRFDCQIALSPGPMERFQLNFGYLFHIIEHAEVRHRRFRVDSTDGIEQYSDHYVTFAQLYPVSFGEADETYLTQLKVFLTKDQYEAVIADPERSFTIRLCRDGEK